MTNNVMVEIDRSVCIGAGDCVRIAPLTFALDGEALAVVLDQRSSTPELLKQAERACPSGAITLVKEG